MAKDLTYEPEQTSRALVKSGIESKVVPFEPQNEPVSLRDSTFKSTGTKRVTKAQEKILTAPPEPNEIGILPSGELYPFQIAMRRRLAKAFGPMGWSLRPVSEIPKPQHKDGAEIIYREYALVADGRVVATAIGSGKYYGSNARMDYSDVTEALKSDALKRCCKDLNMLSELWDPQWCRQWRNEYAVHVFDAERITRGEKRGTVEQVAKWRRIDGEPFPGEFEIIKDSPNQEEWRRQMAGWRAYIDQQAELARAEAARLKASKRNLSNARAELRDAGGNVRSSGYSMSDAPPIDTTAVREPEPKPDATERDSRPHVPHGVRTEDKPYLIRNCKIAVKKTANNATMYLIVMMNDAEYFTFSDRVYQEMQMHFAKRERILIQFETKKVGDKTYRMITEWQVKK